MNRTLGTLAVLIVVGCRTDPVSDQAPSETDLRVTRILQRLRQSGVEPTAAEEQGLSGA